MTDKTECSSKCREKQFTLPVPCLSCEKEICSQHHWAYGNDTFSHRHDQDHGCKYFSCSKECFEKLLEKAYENILGKSKNGKEFHSKSY